MTVFVPKKVLIEEKAVDYPLGAQLLKKFKGLNIPISLIPSHNRIGGSQKKSDLEKYQEAKSTLVIGVRKTMEFQTCKPSAHYQLPLATSCPGMCQYCYLQTTLGKRPFIRIYVNQDEILQQAEKYMTERSPEVTVFEGAATSDPLAVEPYSGGLAKAIEFFGKSQLGRFRFVTKFTQVDSLLGLNHNKQTRFRFSINTDEVIKKFEHNTPLLKDRLAALNKVQKAGYPVGVIIAPIILYDNWELHYTELLEQLAHQLIDHEDFTFELISHRYTKKAKNNILSLFPQSQLPLDEEKREIKYGQFGYMKYVYPKNQLTQVKELFEKKLDSEFPQCKVEYFI